MAISVLPTPNNSSHQLLTWSRWVRSMMCELQIKSKKRHVSLRAASTAPADASMYRHVSSGSANWTYLAGNEPPYSVPTDASITVLLHSDLVMTETRLPLLLTRSGD